MLLLPSLIRMLPPSMKKQNIEEKYFSVSLEDIDDEKEVTNGVVIVIDDSLTHSLFSMSSILDSEIYVRDPSHYIPLSLMVRNPMAFRTFA